jgi:subtilisin family serine protease
VRLHRREGPAARRAPGLLVWALLASAAPLAAQPQPGRLEPVLREALRAEVRPSLRARPDLLAAVAPPPDAPAAGALALDVGPSGEARVGVFLWFAGPPPTAALRALGAEVGTVTGEFATARVPLDAVEAVAALPGVRAVEAARVVRAEHDTSMRVVNVETLRTRVGDTFTGSTGAGALVAIYDSGVDLENPDFIEAGGRHRVLAVWDQTVSGNAPAGFGYGFHCDSIAVRNRAAGVAAACPQRDFTGHGTHVAGTAAGSGRATGNNEPAYRFTGVAPGADLIVVKGGNGLFFENNIIDGLHWIRQVAAQLGRPVVVNLSLGGQFGAHDGTRLYERIIDELSGPGYIAVISAGNNGANRNTTPVLQGRLIHGRGFAVTGTTTTFELGLAEHPIAGELCAGHVTQMSVWYGAADRFRLEVERPDGTVVAASHGAQANVPHPNGRVVINNATGGADPRNGDFEGLIVIDGCGTGSGRPLPGTWRVRATPTAPGSGGPIDVWVTQSSHGSPAVPMFGGAGFDNRFVVASPGNATRAITVAAFATRMCWPSIATTGQICYVQREQIGDLARFSSGGPRRDGFAKPEIAAPGIGIGSSRSRDANYNSNLVLPDGVHVINQGTSMAAPHVTGAVAILFQARPGLTPEDAKDALRRSAVQDAFTGLTYDVVPGGNPADWWGHGKLDVREALVAVSGEGTAVLVLDAAPAIAPAAQSSRRGARLSLLRLRLSGDGPEAIDVQELVFRVRGADPQARVVVGRDADGDGRLGAGDPILGAAAAALGPEPVTVRVQPDGLRVPAFGTAEVIVAIELSGATPHAATFDAVFVPPETRAVGVASGARSPLRFDAETVASGPAATTVLGAGEAVSISENPVRGGRVIFNFVEPPEVAAIYTPAGRRVADLAGAAVRIEWDLRNDRGERVVPGVYLLVFRVRGELFRERLMVLTPAAASGGAAN